MVGLLHEAGAAVETEAWRLFWLLCHTGHYLLMHSAFAREASFHKRDDLAEDVFNFQIKVSEAVAKAVVATTLS